MPVGTRTTLAAVAPAGNHISAALKSGRTPSMLIAQANEQIAELIVTLKAVVADMQTGDANIATVNTLITNLS